MFEGNLDILISYFQAEITHTVHFLIINSIQHMYCCTHRKAVIMILTHLLRLYQNLHERKDSISFYFY